MKLITILLAVLTLNGCATKKLEHAYLLGVWKSNEAMTLQSMHSAPKVTEKAKKLFEKDFFGKLMVEYKQSEFRASLTGDWSDSEYHPYRVVEVKDNHIKLASGSELLGDYEVTIYPEGDCYYLILSGFEFREYFCRVVN